jgi:hypothetical protein
VPFKAVHADKPSHFFQAAMGGHSAPLDARVVPPSQMRERADARAVHRSKHSAVLSYRAHKRLQGAVAAGAAKEQQLAEIYGVRISDNDARKYFGTDYEKHYKPPSAKQLNEYIQYLADHVPANATAGERAAEAECAEDSKDCVEHVAWPEAPKFGDKHKLHAMTQWCVWPGGEEEVPCQIGKNGAWFHEPFSAGLWGRHSPNRETMVNNGVWRFPGHKPPKARFPPRTVRP